MAARHAGARESLRPRRRLPGTCAIQRRRLFLDRALPRARSRRPSFGSLAALWLANEDLSAHYGTGYLGGGQSECRGPAAGSAGAAGWLLRKNRDKAVHAVIPKAGRCFPAFQGRRRTRAHAAKGATHAACADGRPIKSPPEPRILNRRVRRMAVVSAALAAPYRRSAAAGPGLRAADSLARPRARGGASCAAPAVPPRQPRPACSPLARRRPIARH